MMKTEELKLVAEWDKTFPKSDKVDHKKVTFINRYGITLAADMYTPKNAEGELPAIAVSGPFGAVKEQCSVNSCYNTDSSSISSIQRTETVFLNFQCFIYG